MAIVNASGSAWSAVYLDHASSKGDQEGFLIGEVVSEVTTNISDSQISRKTEQISINIYSHYPCTEPFSFYDSKGNVDKVRLLAMLKENYRNVIGWYQMRRNVPLEPTLRDITLHHQLIKTLRNVSPNTFILGLFSTNMSWNEAIHSMVHQFYTVTNNGFTCVPLAVNNLGETAQTEYRLSASTVSSAANSTYTQILNSFKPKLLHPGGTVEGVQKVHQLNETIHERLKTLTGSVGESEVQVQRLTDEVNDLERRAQRQRREKLAATAPTGKPPLPSVVIPSPNPAAPIVKSPPPIVIQPTAPPVPHMSISSHAAKDRTDGRSRDRKTVADVEEKMDTTPVKEKVSSKPADPFEGLLADMKDSIKKAPSFKNAMNAGDGPRPDRSQTFPQISDVEGGDSLQRHQTRSSSLGNEQISSGSSQDGCSSGDRNNLVKSRQSPSANNNDHKMGEQNNGDDDDDDDATQLSDNFQYTQSGSPTF